ncbi:hypothetical protein BDW02DRAFT_571907 [Decorospora gaudefroyi]|uniref:Ifi-6-16 domain-containing protein n=1 Tax=Decorospora gaudefroyi TaxID=184978 RepID=A0A6A5KDX7_9PLEO|nr:hypothetical protein BDW02DRAFT_571907 [Decorospora gaudefroyi]
MGFFDDAWKAMDGFGQEAAKQVGPVAGEAWKHLDAFGQEAGKAMGPAAAETWKHLDAFGQEAGKAIGPAAAETWKHMDKFGHEHVGPAALRTKEWIKEHPGETAGIVACVVAAPVAIGVAGKVLRVAGFARSGVVAGSAAAAYQAGAGNIVAGSAFATLQSAGAGGAGAAVVNGIAAGTATAVAVAATVPGLVKLDTEGKDGAAEEGGLASQMTVQEREKSVLELREDEERIFAVGDEDEDVVPGGQDGDVGGLEKKVE